MPQISIRIPQEIKSQLDFLSKIYNVDLSTLVRDILIPVGVIRKIAEQIETTEKTEKMLVQLIIETPEFQQLLRELEEKFSRVEKVFAGFSGEKMHYVKSLFGDLQYDIIEKNNRMYPVELVENEVCNEYGTCWRDETLPFIEQEIETIEELVEFLHYITDRLSEIRDEKLESLANALKKIRELVM